MRAAEQRESQIYELLPDRHREAVWINEIAFNHLPHAGTAFTLPAVMRQRHIRPQGRGQHGFVFRTAELLPAGVQLNRVFHPDFPILRISRLMGDAEYIRWRCVRSGTS